MFILGAQNPGVDDLCACGVKLCLGRDDITTGNNADFVFIFGDFECSTVGIDGGLTKSDAFVSDPQLELRLRQSRLDRKPSIGEIGSTHLSRGDISFSQATHAAPEVGRPTRA